MVALYTAVSAQEKSECPVRVTILQVNDVYQFAPVDFGKSGGLARVLTLRKRIMRESPNTLFLFSGDTISPSIESNTKMDGKMLQGRQMIEAWNLTGLDYAAFGNHEFDYGPNVLLDRVRESNFKWLGAHVTTTASKRGEALVRSLGCDEVIDYASHSISKAGRNAHSVEITKRPS